jgi:hypothetical protein
MKHEQPHPLAGKTVRIADGVTDPGRGMVVAGAEYRIEDWWDRVAGASWTTMHTNPAVVQYGLRIFTTETVPVNDDVVYGKIGRSLGHLVHVSELGEVIE